MDDRDKDLLPCPCCGAPAVFTTTSLPDSYSDHDVIACTECRLQMDDADMDAWNKRTRS
jgi:hypothetical protein